MQNDNSLSEKNIRDNIDKYLVNMPKSRSDGHTKAINGVGHVMCCLASRCVQKSM